MPAWNLPREPFCIVGNLYYVGTNAIAVYLLATPEGLILIDSGFRESAPIIEANVKKLGFKLDDIRLLLINHAHYDHVGGMAGLKERTKARLLAHPADASLLARGGKDDFAYGDEVSYPPVRADALLRDNEEVQLGNTTLTAIFTPGHTKGCTSWFTTIEERGKRYNVVICGSLTAPGYRLIENPKYPEILVDFSASIDRLRKLPCDIYLSFHSQIYGLEQKVQALVANPKDNPFIDPTGYRLMLDNAQARLASDAEKQRQVARE